MYGIDISSYQKGIDLSKDNFDFAIVKATEGVGFKDKCFDDFIVQLTKLNKLIGVYHFARPDLNHGLDGMIREAEWFVKVVKEAGLIGKAILVLDWEREPFDRDDYISQWITWVESQTGITPFIYGSKSKLTKWKDFWSFNHCPIWMAAWPSGNFEFVGTTPGMASKDSVNWKIWQYSANGCLEGFKGLVDLDYSDLTREEWLKMAGCKNEEYLSDDMQWAIKHKLFQGYKDGFYHPNEPLSRDHAATVLHRLYTLIKEELK